MNGKSWTCDKWHTYESGSPKSGVGIILDNGCRRNVGGSKWHAQVQAMLRRFGLKGERIDMQEEFLFGSDRVDRSICAWLYPVGVHGRCGTINVAEIESNCPGLLSADTMAALDISLHTRPQTYDIGTHGIKDYKYEISPSGHAMMRIDWFGDVSKYDPKFHIEQDPKLSVKSGLAKRLRKAASFINEMFAPATETVPQPQVCESGDT